jgi:glycosyltransferase involved in cell wall biosynthesis
MVLFLGRLHPIKGLELLIPAFARLQMDDVKLVLAGPGEPAYVQHLKDLLAQHGIARRAVFTEMLDGPARVAALCDADLFVLPSYHENFGIVVIEALAAACPVIVSQEVQIHEQITAAKVGAAVPTTVDALAAEIDRWMRDDELRRLASARARQFVWENFDWRRIASRWSGHYATLLNGTRQVF